MDALTFLDLDLDDGDVMMMNWTTLSECHGIHNGKPTSPHQTQPQQDQVQYQNMRSRANPTPNRQVRQTQAHVHAVAVEASEQQPATEALALVGNEAERSAPVERKVD